MPKSAQAKMPTAKSAQVKSSARASAPAVSDRSQLVKSLVDLYVAQDMHHSKSEQKQFLTLIQSHWADMPKSMQAEISKKLSVREDLDAGLISLLNIKPAVAVQKTQAPKAKPKQEQQKPVQKAKSKPAASQKAVVQKTLQKQEPKKSQAQVGSKLPSAQQQPGIWWEQPSLFFGMKLEARQTGLLALSERKFECAQLYAIPSYSFDQFKRNYFANKSDVVQSLLCEYLNLSPEIAKAIIDDKDMLGICIAARAMGANEKDITSIVIFNASQFSNPSFDAFDRIKWFAKIPSIAIEQMLHILQGKMMTKLKSQPAKPSSKASGQPQKALSAVKVDLGKNTAAEQKKPKLQFNAAAAFQPKKPVLNAASHFKNVSSASKAGNVS